jgi:tRNA threonylcarbamoyladenosine biosynthesis protein TsaB
MELAIETALHACSAALIDEGRIVAERHEVIARGHAERLVPLVSELLLEAGVRRADRVIVDVGPGSFTGIRVGLAAAKAFGMAWRAPVEGCTSTALVAAGLLADRSDLDRVYVAFDASRGEVYGQAFDCGEPTGEVAALTPVDAAADARGRTVVGSGAALLAAVDPTLVVVDRPWPRAADVRHMAPGARVAAVRPLYLRPPDAKVPA